jgi:hypothetical protein
MVTRLRTGSTYNWRLGYTCNGSVVYVDGANFTLGVGVNDVVVFGTTPSDLNSQEIKLDFKLYPNPTSGEVTLELNGFASGPAELRLLDVRGRTIMTRKEELTTGLQFIKLNLHNLINGNYMIQIVQNGKYYTTRFMKM